MPPGLDYSWAYHTSASHLCDVIRCAGHVTAGPPTGRLMT